MSNKYLILFVPNILICYFDQSDHRKTVHIHGSYSLIVYVTAAFHTHNGSPIATSQPPYRFQWKFTSQTRLNPHNGQEILNIIAEYSLKLRFLWQQEKAYPRKFNFKNSFKRIIFRKFQERKSFSWLQSY